MAHASTSHVTHTNGPCHTHHRVTWHRSTSHVTQINESCHTDQQVTSHKLTGHVKHITEACQKYTRGVIASELCHAYVIHMTYTQCVAVCCSVLQHTSYRWHTHVVHMRRRYVIHMYLRHTYVHTAWHMTYVWHIYDIHHTYMYIYHTYVIYTSYIWAIRRSHIWHTSYMCLCIIHMT